MSTRFAPLQRECRRAMCKIQRLHERTIPAHDTGPRRSKPAVMRVAFTSRRRTSSWVACARNIVAGIAFLSTSAALAADERLTHVRLLYQIHDELLYEVPDDQLQRTAGAWWCVSEQ